MRTRLIPLCLLVAGSALLVESTGHAQTRVDIRSQSKSVDFSAADSTKPFKTGTVLPASCSAGEAFFKSDAAPGANIYLCLATNLWTQATSGSGGLNVSSGSAANRPAACGSGQLYFSTDPGAEGWSYCLTPGNPGVWSATVKGADGYSPQYRVAAGAPSNSTGNIGDMYLNSVTGDLYGPKTASSWGPVIANLKGAAGPVCGSSGQLLMNSGGVCAGVTPTGTGAPVQAESPLLNTPMLSNPSTGTGPVTETWTCSSAVNTAYTLVKLDPANPGAILPVHSPDTAPYGVATSTCAAGTSVQVARFGRVSCVADTNGAGTTTPGNAAVISTTFDGYCMDSGKASTLLGNLTQMVGIIQNSATTGALATVVLTPSQYGNQVSQSTLPAPYDGWPSNTLLSGGGAGAAPTVTSVTIDETNNISTPGSVQTGAGSGSAGSVVALRGTGTAKLGVQGATAGEWDITPPDNFTSWSFTPPAAPCGAHQWWTTDSAGNGNCTQPASSDLADASNLDLLSANQAFTGDKTFGGKMDASAASHTLPARTGPAAAKPATCTVGEMYFATDAAAGQNWYFCTASNTWTQQLNSGGGGGVASGTTLPATCTAGSLYALTAKYTSNTYNYYPGLFACTAPNAWTAGANVTAAGSTVLFPPADGFYGYGGVSAAFPSATYPLYTQFTIKETFTMSTWTTRINAPSAGNYIGVNLYDSSCNLIGPATTTGAATSGSNYPAGTLTYTLGPGTYYLAVWASSTSPTFYYMGENIYGWSVILGTLPVKRFGTGSNAASNSGSTITWPASCGTITPVTNSGPFIVGLAN